MESRLREKAKKYLAMCSIGILAGIEGGSIATQIVNLNNESSSNTFSCEIEYEHMHELSKPIINSEGDEVIIICWATDEEIERLLHGGYELTGNIKSNGPVQTLTRK